jgi:dissimilatory sulfite reductase (desulfoviridin) alpha/beta subunit
MAIMVFVSQNEKEFHACPSMPHAVTAEASHAVAADGTHAVAGDGSHAVARDGSHAVAADRCVRACAAAAARRA